MNRINWPAIFVAALLFLLGMVFSAQSQAVACAPLQRVLKLLRDRHNEFVVMTANAETHLVYLTASDAGTWSLLKVIGGNACLVDAGRNAEWMKGV